MGELGGALHILPGLGKVPVLLAGADQLGKAGVEPDWLGLPRLRVVKLLPDGGQTAGGLVGGQIGQQHHKVHIAEAEAAALGEQPLQQTAGLGQQQISCAVAQALVHHGKAAQRDQNQLKVLLSRQQQGQLVVEPVAVPKTGEAVQLGAAALQADEQQQIGKGHHGAVEGEPGAAQLKGGQQEQQQGQHPKGLYRSGGDAGPVAQEAQNGKPQLNDHKQVGQGFRGPRW